MEKFANCSLYKNLKNLFPKMSEKQLLETTSLVGLLVGLTISDKKVRRKEAHYLKKIFAPLEKIEKGLADEVVQVSLFLVKKKYSYSKMIDVYKEYLFDHYPESKKESLVKALFILSQSDNEIHVMEKSFIKSIVNYFNLDREVYLRAKKHAEEVLKEKLDAEYDEPVILHGSEKYSV